VKPCIWYVSKYVAPPAKVGAGGRGYLIMREFARMGYQCVIITSDSNQLTEVPVLEEPYLFQEVDGLRLCWVRTMKYTGAKSLRRILSWLDFEWRLGRLPKDRLPAPDVVIVSSLSLLTILNGFLLRRRYGCRLVLEIRDIWPLTITEEGGFSRWNPLVLGLGFIEKLGYRYADAIVGTMPNLGEHVAGVLGRPKTTHCIPMAVDEAALGPGEALPADYVETYIPKGKFIVAHAGTIGITNALDTMLDCAEAMKDDPRVHFLVVGEGDLRVHYQRKYAHLPNLTFAPRVPKQMVQSVLSHCDLLYFSVHVSTVWRYGQSLNKVIDYMLAGKPVVASYTGYPSMINEADCGTYVPAGDIDALRREVLRYAAMDAARRDAGPELPGHPGRSSGSRGGAMKRLFDLFLSIGLMLALALPLLLLWALVRRKLGSPVLFRQVRPGMYGRPFMMVKFRTMTDERGAEGELLPDAQRLTPFGRFLRATSLDELPELWNVLRGEMSLVGPRPLLMEYLPLYSPEQARRHEVRPGITGWAQVNGRNTLSWEERFKLDVWYVDHRSLWLDIRILWLTVRKVIVREGISAQGEATMPRFTGNKP
jgi:lipopolysaccharide/colanic/teichoic acid biosynthesis glycosyltransferase